MSGNNGSVGFFFYIIYLFIYLFIFYLFILFIYYFFLFIYIYIFFCHYATPACFFFTRINVVFIEEKES